GEVRLWWQRRWRGDDGDEEGGQRRGGKGGVDGDDVVDLAEAAGWLLMACDSGWGLLWW
ncbi:hypothetical protein Tco_1574915, partial [Tanacetum coccineum]